jgi:two-component system, NarL family, nitrate/nitrite response regulator NarL
MKDKYRLAIVDDHPLVRLGMTETLQDEPDFEVVAQGVSADDAVRIAAEDKPHLMFLDVNMPGGGVLAAAKINAMAPDVVIAMFSFRQDLAIVRASLAAGASGYIVKGIPGAELRELSRKLLTGGQWLDPELVRRLAVEQTDPELQMRIRVPDDIC